MRVRSLLFLIALTSLSAWAVPAPAATATLSVDMPTVATAPALKPDLSDPVWQKAVKVQLGFDRLIHGAAAEATTAYLLTDGKSMFVAFDATQTRTPIVMNQRTNNVGVDTDDEVKVSLWPGGRNGINYQFIATPAAVKYQYSTENSNYEPSWDAVAATKSNGYIVVMRIPLSVMRGAQPTWLLNITRYEPTTGALYAWSGGENFQGTTDVNYAEPLLNMPKVAAVRPKPRVGLYTLADQRSPALGGFTSRAGADLAIPVTSGTSIVAALHPDFSNVENDQQTISPTAFRRFYSETRPFFTQGANYYNVYECDACPNENSLYSPSIPTPRDGYALEGHEGVLNFGAFDAVGVGRNDAAESLVFKNTPGNLFISSQRVSVNMPGLKDDTLQFGAKWDDLKHRFIYANYGTETGSLVTDPSQAKFEEIGGGYYTANTFTGGGLRKIGAQYNPYDGFVGNQAIAGWSVFSNHNWYPRGGFVKQINGYISFDRYKDTTGLGKALEDQGTGIDIVTRKLWEYGTNIGSDYFLIVDPTTKIATVTPITQQSTFLIYHSGTATPTKIALSTGIFGDGRLNAWNRTTTFSIARRFFVTLQAYDTQQFLRTGVNTQWLERFSVAYAQGPDASIAFGVRRIIGAGPLLGGSQDLSCVAGCSNISFAYHKKFGFNELYVAYGDPSQLNTRAQFLVKLIRYVGAEKGT
jgi:hypothetical protein